MDRRGFAKAAGVGAVGSIVAAPAIAQSSPEVKWRWVSSFPKSSHAWPMIEAFAKRVGEITDGKFQISLFGPNEIVAPLQVLDAVQNGTVEAGITATYFYIGKDPSFVFGSAVPFGLNARQHVAWMKAGGGGQLFNEFLAGHNVTYVGMGLTGAQMGGWYRKEIKSVADLKGLKMRITGFGGTIMSRLGVVPQVIAAGDTYAALERGIIDAVEYTNPVDDEQMGLFKVAKYYYYPGWWEGNVQVGHLINKKKWEELPARYKTAIEAVSVEQEQAILNGYDAKNAAALRRLLGQGAELRPFPKDLMQAGYKETLAYLDEISGQNAQFKKLLTHYMAFRNDSILWHRIAEGTYDNFVQAESARVKR